MTNFPAHTWAVAVDELVQVGMIVFHDPMFRKTAGGIHVNLPGIGDLALQGGTMLPAGHRAVAVLHEPREGWSLLVAGGATIEAAKDELREQLISEWVGRVGEKAARRKIASWNGNIEPLVDVAELFLNGNT
jgi:hypothetical protein